MAVQNGDVESRSVLLGVGIGKYEDDQLDELPHAVSDVEEVAEYFRAAGFAPELVLDKSREVVVDAIDDALPQDGLKHSGTVLVVIWTGHGEPSTDTGSLQLLATDNRANSPGLRVVTADQVAQIAARSGASQMLLIIDACHAGSAVIDAARVVDVVRRKVSDQKHRWVGILASCQDYEHARDGALAKKLVELLHNGPVEEALQLRWNSYQAGVRGDDLIDALVKEWDEERQQPKQNSQGDAQPILPNPLYQPDAPEQVVEHLLWAARGGGQSEAGIWFTGRVGPLREVVGAIHSGEPGLCVITGPAGCGKSAVAGRIVSLSNPHERTKIEAAQSAPPSDLDPGESSIDAHFQARGTTLERCSEQLGRALKVVGRDPVLNHHELLAWASSQTHSPVIIVDGLDEAGAEGFRIASDLLEPLAQYALVIVATREVPGDDKQPSLLDSLGATLLTIDLEGDSGETDRDVHDYVVARLTDPGGRAIAETMDPVLVAKGVVRLARANGGAPEGSFLLARILTSQLMERPVDTSAPDWQEPLSASVEEAFARDVSGGRPLVRDGEDLRWAGRELLSALAYSYGPGFPIDDVWPAVASALSEADTSYNRLDAYWALGEHGRYVTASSLDGQAVYRLHQRLTETLRRSEGSGAWRKVEESTGAAIARTVMRVYEEFIEAGRSAAEHPYLWRYAWLHAADGGAVGIEALAQLADGELALRPDLAMALDNLGNRYSAVGRRADAVAPTERAVEIREQLAAENPAFLNDLAGSLNNLGIHYSAVGRRADAVAPTERAVEIWEQLAAENPAFLNDLAGSLNNLGNRYSEMGRRADAVAPTERAVEIWEQLAAENPAFLNDLASSLNNLGIHYSEMGRLADAVAPTERAVEIREQLAAENPAFLNDLAGSLNNLGIRYSEMGRRADAVAPTERAVEIYEQLAAENPAFLNDLASSLNNLVLRYGEVGDRSGGRGRWAATLKRFAEDPRASVILRLRRSRSEDELDEAIADVLQAADLDPGDNSSLTQEVHTACRSVRAKHQERFDSAWQERAGDLPNWLLLDNEVLVSSAEWLDTRTWADSREYLLAHADQLLAETGQIALAEIGLAIPNDEIVSRHEALLEECLRDGVDSAYRPLLIADTVREWRSLFDPQESRQFLLDRRDELLTDEASAVLAQVRDMQGQALLSLARADKAELAYAMLEGREPCTKALADARRDGDSDQLNAVAVLCLTAADGDAQRSQAAVHLAMSLAIAGRGDDASRLIREVCKASDVPGAIDDLADAISHRTQDAASLASLIRALPQSEARDEAQSID